MSSNAKLVNFADTFALLEDNASRDIKTSVDLFPDKHNQGDLVDRLSRGFDVSLGTIGLYELSPQQVESVTQRLTQWHETLKAAKEEIKLTLPRTTEKGVNWVEIGFHPSDYLRAWEALHLDKKGNIIVPRYGVFDGQRRWYAFHDAQMLRLRQTPPADVETKIWCDIIQFADVAMRDETSIVRNVQKLKGNQTLSHKDKMAAAKRLFDLSVLETRVRDIFGTWTQKTYEIMRLDRRFPELKLYQMTKEDEKYYGRLKATELRQLRDVQSAATVSEYLDKVYNEERAEAMADKKAIQAIATQSPVDFVQDVAKAIIDNKIPNLNEKYVDSAPILNRWVPHLINGNFELLLELTRNLASQAPYTVLTAEWDRLLQVNAFAKLFTKEQLEALIATQPAQA